MAAAGAAASLSLWLLGQSPAHAQTAQSSAACPPLSSPPTVSAPSTPPASQTTPQQLIVACVGSAQITQASFQHWSTIAQAAQSSPPRHPAASAHEILEEVMGFLVSGDWVIGEARDLKVHVSPAQVRRELNRVRTEQFPTRKAFRAFLRHTKQTVADLLLRTELQLLSQRIYRHVVAGQRGARGRERAVEHYVEHFRTKWLSQTYCAPQYAVAQCGHVQASL